MDLRTVPFERLTGEERAVWSAIQRAEPHLDSPLFRPEFTEAVAAVRNDVEVAVLETNGSPVGFFPFQRSRWNTGGPVGGMLSDFQDLIAPAGVSCEPRELLRRCRLTALHFDHLLASHSCFAPFVWRYADSPYVDLSDGMDSYIAQRDNGRRIMSEYGWKCRKLARRVGPLRYEAHVPEPDIVSTFVQWKSDQYRRTRARDIFDYAWVRDLLDKILEYDGDDFAAMVSVLYAGDTIAAINFGIRSKSVLHPWFPTYNVELASYSPGYIYWIETMKACQSLGIRRIDLGKGAQPYKHRFMTGAAQVAEGTVDRRAATALVRRGLLNTRESLRTSPFAAPVRLPVRAARRVRHWVGCTLSNMVRNT